MLGGGGILGNSGIDRPIPVTLVLGPDQEPVGPTNPVPVAVYNFPGSQNVVVTNEVEVKNESGNPLSVSSTDLDIRDLLFASDKVDVSGSVVTLDSTSLAALENITVTVSNEVEIKNDSGNPVPVNGIVTANIGTTGGLALETTQTSNGTKLDEIEQELDDANVKLDSLITQATAINSNTDTLETLITSTNGKIDTVNTNLGVLHTDNVTIEGKLDTGNTNTSNVYTRQADGSQKTKLVDSSNAYYASTNSFPVNLGQDLDTNNTAVLTSASVVPFTGDWSLTRDSGYASVHTIVASNVASGLGGTFTFQFSEDMVTPTVDELRPITSFSSLRNFPLENFGKYYRVIFNPSRALALGEFVFITTQKNRYSIPFSRLANQEIEEQNAAMSQTFAYQKKFDLTGVSTNIRTGGLDPTNSTTTPLGIGGTFTGTYRKTDNYESALIFIVSDVPLNSVLLRWSADGSTTRSGLLSTTVLTSTIISGFYVYINVLTTLIDRYVRLEIINDGSATTFFEADLWLYQGAFPGSFGGLSADLSSLSTALLTRAVQAGIDPNEEFKNFRAQGSHDGNSTSTPLAAGGIFRGTWFPWQENYVKLITDLRSDVAGTLYIDFSEAVAPVDGSDADIVGIPLTFAYDPSATPLFYRQTPIQSKWVRHRYINGIAAQSVFGLDAGFTISDPGLVSQSLSILPLAKGEAGVVRSVPAILNAAGSAYVEVPVDSVTGNPKVTVSNIRDDVLIEPLSSASATQLALGTTATRIDPSPLSNRRVVSITNEGPGRVSIGHSSAITFDSSSVRLPVARTKTFGIDSGIEMWAIVENTGGVQSTLDRTGTTSAGTATNTANAKTSGNSYATMTSGQTVDISSFTAGTANTLVSVKLGLEANKTASQFETVAFQDVKTGNSAAVGTVATSASVTAVNNHFYIAAVGREANAVVSSISGIGLTWTKLLQKDSDDANRAVDVWYAQGTVTTSGVVTASFATNPTTAHISVSRFSNVDPTTPIQASNSGATNSSTPSAGAVAGTNKGEVVMVVEYDNATTFTPGAGYTSVSAEFGNEGLGVLRKDLTSTANDTPTSTISAGKHWAAISLTLTPAAAVDPIITLSYTLSAVTGATSGTVTLTSSTDSTSFVDVTADRSWVVGDIANVHVIATGTTISAAAANIDEVFLRLIDSTGNTSRVSVWQGAKANT